MLLTDKKIKPKAKIELLASLILEGKISNDALIDFAEGARDADKASCLEAMESATKTDRRICNAAFFNFACYCLGSGSSRVNGKQPK